VVALLGASLFIPVSAPIASALPFAEGTELNIEVTRDQFNQFRETFGPGEGNNLGRVRVGDNDDNPYHAAWETEWETPGCFTVGGGSSPGGFYIYVVPESNATDENCPAGSYAATFPVKLDLFDDEDGSYIGTQTLYMFTITVDLRADDDDVPGDNDDDVPGDNGDEGAPVISVGDDGLIIITDPEGLEFTTDVSTDDGVDVVLVDGQIRVITPGFSGNLSVMITATNSNDASSTLIVQIVVNPNPVTGATARTAIDRTPMRANSVYAKATTVSWVRSINAIGYQVLVNGTPAVTVGSTTSSVSLRVLQSARDIIEVVALGRDETQSPAVTATKRTSAAIIGHVNFASNSAALSTPAKRALNRLAQAAIDSEQKRIRLEGHADRRGGDKSNAAISAARATAVQQYLAKRLRGTGVELLVTSSSSRKPVASNASERGRAANRRVEVTFTH
jgi:outer membrane protein OmpA-like peptidoglycan-associated protein